MVVGFEWRASLLSERNAIGQSLRRHTRSWVVIDQSQSAYISIKGWLTCSFSPFKPLINILEYITFNLNPSICAHIMFY